MQRRADLVQATLRIEFIFLYAAKWVCSKKKREVAESSKWFGQKRHQAEGGQYRPARVHFAGEAKGIELPRRCLARKNEKSASLGSNPL
jgi:hypothetical protein